LKVREGCRTLTEEESSVLAPSMAENLREATILSNCKPDFLIAMALDQQSEEARQNGVVKG
jgi:hypothetical protein